MIFDLYIDRRNLCEIYTKLLLVTPVAASGNYSRVGLARRMASAVARAYTGGLGAEPPAGCPGGRAPGGGSGGRSPPEADDTFVLEHTFLRSPGGILQ